MVVFHIMLKMINNRLSKVEGSFSWIKYSRQDLYISFHYDEHGVKESKQKIGKRWGLFL